MMLKMLIVGLSLSSQQPSVVVLLTAQSSGRKKWSWSFGGDVDDGSLVSLS
jgi:hypothetical protein